MTAKQIIDALGGFAAVAEIFAVGESAVRNWSAWNRFPPRHHFRLYRICKERGIEFDPAKMEAA